MHGEKRGDQDYREKSTLVKLVFQHGEYEYEYSVSWGSSFRTDPLGALRGLTFVLNAVKKWLPSFFHSGWNQHR